MELYIERGFDNTTVAAIAERAGLTERTFFRHFADKREVLFGGAAMLQQFMVDAIAAAPDTASPLEMVVTALDALESVFTDRQFSLQRQAVISASAELREREVLKLATLGAAVAEALRLRGVKEPAASLTAQTGMTIFSVAFERWIGDKKKRTFSVLIQESLVELRSITAG